MQRTSRETFTDASTDCIFEAVFTTSASATQYSFSGSVPPGVTVTHDRAMPLTVMIAVGSTGGMPFFVTASTAP
jgi:hypothetical protein